MTKFNIINSDDACLACVKKYQAKHGLSRGDKFELPCQGIPKLYSEDLSIKTMLDPVEWAAKVLDWHCLDADKIIWERKDPIQKARFEERFGSDIPSRYHRPYQAEMLRCTSQNRIYRCGRQIGKTEVLVVYILFTMFTNKKFPVLVVTPRQSQITMIFNRIEEFFKNNPDLQNSVKRQVRSPNAEIELYNGSSVKGFTAGTGGGNQGVSIRGQTAKLLVLDEADYLEDEDMASIMGVIAANPDAVTWMSSTPTGKRQKYYELCNNRKWKEFFYPSYVNPHFTKEADDNFRAIFTKTMYEQEIKAEFGQDMAGVFLPEFVDRAEFDYHYYDSLPQTNYRYTIGVDWNDYKNGTSIVVCGLNTDTGVVSVIERHSITREGWTQLSACDKIRDLNRKWNPDLIYIDSGYGATQHELLKLFGVQARQAGDAGHPADKRLSNIIRQYQFGGNIEIFDPFTKQPVPKQAKAYLVETAVRFFENGNIRFSKHDVKLKSELLAYVVDRISSNGVPVYCTNNESIGDHNLDAFMLAIVGFALEKVRSQDPHWYTPTVV